MFFLVFFLSTPPEAGMFSNQDNFVPDVTKAEQIQKSASTELHEWSENVVNVENRQFLKGNCEFFSVIWVKWKHSVCSVTLPYSSTFYSLFLPLFVLEIFKFKYVKFSVRHSASMSNIKWFEQPWVEGRRYNQQEEKHSWKKTHTVNKKKALLEN